MKSLRQNLLRCALAAVGFVAGIPAFAADSPTVDVVKIMAFSCPVCRAAESQDPLIEQAVRATGGRFVRGPLPTSETESGAKERLYYASRDISPELGDKVKDALYRGMQDMSLPLAQEPQVYVWFQQQLTDMPDKEFKDLFAASRGNAARASLGRAAKLAGAVAAEALPTYVIVVDGRPVSSLDPSSVTGGSLRALREEVINRVKTAANPK